MSYFRFPDGFLWGTATAAHQIEGNNKHSDWWQWEQTKKPDQKFPLEPSGIACDSYNRYEEDFDWCVKLNNNAVRFSVEWARIEPKQGEFDDREIAHYRKMILAAKKRGLKTFVTLHHFTSPLWMAKKGGWMHPRSADWFSHYAEKCAEELGDIIDTFITINEPQVYAMESYVKGEWPPCKKNIFLSGIVQMNLWRAHNKAYRAIKSFNPKYKVGIVKHIAWYYTDSKIFLPDKLMVAFMNYIGKDFFLRRVRKSLDFIGINFYFTTRIMKLHQKNIDDRNSDLRWWIKPEGLEYALLSLRKYRVPIYVTENGLADAKDVLRKDFIHDMLAACARAIEKGVDLRGYFHWSLLDNYEWAQGFWPRFGLIEIDREHKLKRTPRGSYFYYADICAQNRIEL